MLIVEVEVKGSVGRADQMDAKRKGKSDYYVCPGGWDGVGWIE